MQFDQVKTYLLELQQNICGELAEEDGSADFIVDEWQRAEGGGGRSRVLNEGAVFEKAGGNFSHVQGDALPPALRAPFLLRAHHGLPYREVARALQITERAAKARFKKTRELLAHRLRHLLDAPREAPDR